MIKTPSELLNFLSTFITIAPAGIDFWKEFKEAAIKLEETCVFSSPYPAKKKFRASLSFISDRLFFYCHFPALGAKRIVARVNYDPPFSPEAGLPPIRRIPCLYFTDATTLLYNMAGGQMAFAREDIKNLLDSLAGTRADVDSIISLIVAPAPGMDQHTALFDFPAGSSPENRFFLPLLAAAEDIQIANPGILADRALGYLKYHRPTLPVWIETCGLLRERFREKSRQPRLESPPAAYGPSEGFIRFASLLEWTLYPPLAWNFKRLRSLEKRESLLTDDIIMDPQEPELAALLKSSRDVLRERIRIYQEWTSSYKKFTKDLGFIARQADETIMGASQLNPVGDTAFSHNDWSPAENYLLELLNNNDLKNLIKFIDQLTAHDYPYPFILASAKAVTGNSLPDLAIVNIDRPLAHVLCVLLRSKIGLSDEDAGRHAAKIEDKTPELAYVAGIAALKDSGSEVGVKYLKQALAGGIKEAGEQLFNLAKVSPDNNKNMRFLANHMVPEACFELASRKEGQYFRDRLFMLYIAASQGYPPALRELAKIEKNSSYNKKLDDAEQSKHRRHAIALYELLDKKIGGLDSQGLCDCGMLLCKEKKYQSAYEYLSRSQENDAYFQLGKMYFYGDGVAMDYDKAKSLFVKSKSLGHPKANEMLAKLASKADKKNTLHQKSYSQERVYSSSSSSSSDDWCFLTTATCQAKGFADDCEVLMAYRNFRDTWLAKTAEGQELIKEYYRIAPAIVRSINRRSDAREIYENMWRDYLEPGYRLVLDQKHAEAKDLYIELVKYLLAKFH